MSENQEKGSSDLIEYTGAEPESELLLAQLENLNPGFARAVESDPALKGQLLRNKELLGTLLVSYQSTTITRSGPFPPADEMVIVEKAHKGDIAHLLETQKESLKIRENLARKGMNFALFEGLMSQFAGLVVALFALYIAYDLGMEGHDELAGVIGGGTVVALVTVFVTKKRARKNSSKDSEQSSPSPSE